MSQEPVLVTEFLPLRGAKFLAVLTLNRPQVLNALNLQLVKALYAEVQNCQQRDDVVGVFLRGAGERSFCAGGDIKELYASAVANPGGPCLVAEQFFAYEYRNDYALHCLQKPVIVWGNGIVMGGGMGMMQTGSHRIVTADSRLAMPEVSIALYPDVGASYFFNRLSKPWGRFLALSGATMNATESIVLGLADAMLDVASQEALLEALQQQDWDNDSFTTVSKVVKDMELKVQAQLTKPKSHISDVATDVKAIFSKDDLAELLVLAQQMLQSGELDDWLVAALTAMLAGSPLSLACIDQALTLNAKKSLLEVFQFDLIYATRMVRHPEFAEGVRALLIDKDKRPKWLYQQVADVPQALLAAMLEAPWEQHPFAAL